MAIVSKEQYFAYWFRGEGRIPCSAMGQSLPIAQYLPGLLPSTLLEPSGGLPLVLCFGELLPPAPEEGSLDSPIAHYVTYQLSYPRKGNRRVGLLIRESHMVDAGP